jgi:hypothetical protein
MGAEKGTQTSVGGKSMNTRHLLHSSLRIGVAVVAAGSLLAACGGGASNSSSGNTTPAAGQSPQSVGTKGAPTAPPASPGSDNAPVEFTYLGLNADSTAIHYTIKVNTATPIEQVDLNVKYFDASGAVLLDDRFLWQNIVKSERQPIEAGHTYDVEDYLYPDATRAEAKLLRVVYTDLSSWDAPQ